MAKGRLIEGSAKVVRAGTCLMGMCSLEEYFADLECNGEVYRWRSADAGWLYEGRVVELRAFVRADNNHLYRVSIRG